MSRQRTTNHALDVLRAAAAEGLWQAEALRRAGLSDYTGRYWARKLGLRFAPMPYRLRREHMAAAGRASHREAASATLAEEIAAAKREADTSPPYEGWRRHV